MSVPKDNIQRAIDKATGAGAENIEEVRYEGYGPGGVALIVETLTDNRNRTASDIRSTFSKFGGDGRAQLGHFHVRPRRRDRLCERAKGLTMRCSRSPSMPAPTNAYRAKTVTSSLWVSRISGSVRDALETKLGQPESSKIEWRPKSTNPVNDDAGETLMKLIDTLDDHDDVQTIDGNYELSDALMKKLGD